MGETFAFFCSKAAKARRCRPANHEAFSLFCRAMSNVREAVRAHATRAEVGQRGGRAGSPAVPRISPDNFQIVRFRNPAALAEPAPPASFCRRCARWVADIFHWCSGHPSTRWYSIALVLLVFLPKVLGALSGAMLNKTLNSFVTFCSVVLVGACNSVGGWVVNFVKSQLDSFRKQLGQTLQEALNPTHLVDDWRSPRTVRASGPDPLDTHPAQPLDFLVWVTRAFMLCFLWVARTIVTGGTGG